MPNRIVCDFCSGPDPAWRYPARTFVDEASASLSVADWAACEACHILIETCDRAGLTERSVGLLICARPEMAASAEDIAGMMATLHDSFFENRAGEAQPANG